MKEQRYTLVFVKTSNKLLLGFKKRGLGEGTWNGYGGKLEENEDGINAAIRELHEESNLRVCREDLKYLGVVTYNDACEGRQHRRIVYIFTTEKTSGDLRETDEMKPEWFEFDSIPYASMWPDSRLWVPLVLKDRWLQATFTYTSNCTIEDYEINELCMAPSLTCPLWSCSRKDCSHNLHDYNSFTVYDLDN